MAGATPPAYRPGAGGSARRPLSPQDRRRLIIGATIAGCTEVLTALTQAEARFLDSASALIGHCRTRQDGPGYHGSAHAVAARASTAHADAATVPAQPQGQPGVSSAGAAATVTWPGEPQIPVLTLVTNDSATQTRTSGARAGRGDVELRLPDEGTVSREHARFTFSGGRWWITCLGRNGLTVNGVPLTGTQALEDGDFIRWGRRWNALLSRVNIG